MSTMQTFRPAGQVLKMAPPVVTPDSNWRDPLWREKIARAKEARILGQSLHAGKPVTMRQGR